MELYQASDHYILVDGEHSLWCNRFNGSLKAGKGTDLCLAWNPICLGLVYGVIGKIKPHPDSESWLLLIRQKSFVGKFFNKHDVYQINRIAVLPLSTSEPSDLDIELCRKHHFGIKKQERITQAAQGQKRALQKTLSSIKSAAENVKPKKKEVKDKEKFEKKMLEELQKMFNEEESFFFSETMDLTTSIQQQHDPGYNQSSIPWKRADERFFWNKQMMKELIDSQDELADHWIVPVIQGYIQQELCKMDFTENHSPVDDFLSPSLSSKHDDCLKFMMSLISRRSRHRAGTRSKKRGLDENGHCANYVETEQILEYTPHVVSFVQVRGSAPMFWSQSGFKYRPPPILDKDESATHEAFCKHLDEQLLLYKQLAIISLSELSGKEQIIGEAFLSHILDYNSSTVTFITFDFHDYCRGMKFENVSVLTDTIKDVIKAMRYCWVDNQGMICSQQGVFRVNCIDCLDRTNVVQSAVGRIVMETQCRKLGLLPPDEELPSSCRLIYQQLWANNGDAISQQYAGTVALKGDYTRTGERKFSGLMKDGMNSANRYYLRFRDTYRQAVIDLMLGQPISEEALYLGSTKLSPEDEDDGTELLEKEENVRQIIEDCKTMLIVEPEECLGGWGLVDADPVSGEPDRQEMDAILLLTQRAIYVAWYDDDKEQFTKYQRIFLEDIEKIEMGLEPSLFKSKYILLRIHYHNYAEEGYFHSFRAPNTRFFNNTVISINTPEEARESLRSICQSFTGALKIFTLELDVAERQKLDRKKSRPHPEVTDIHKKIQETSLAAVKMSRDHSSTDLKLLQQNQIDRDIETNSKGGKSRLINDDESGVHMSSKPFQSTPKSSRLQQAFSLVNKNYNRVMPNLKMPVRMSVPKLNIDLKRFNPLDLKIPVRMSVPKMTLRSLNPLQIIRHSHEKSRAEPKAETESDIDSGKDATAGPVSKVSRSHGRLSREYSHDDASLVGSREVDLIDAVASGSFDLDDETDNEVMLHSCGILATNHGQLIATSLSSLDDTPSHDDQPISIKHLPATTVSSAKDKKTHLDSKSANKDVDLPSSSSLTSHNFTKNPLASKSDSHIICKDKLSDAKPTVSAEDSLLPKRKSVSGGLDPVSNGEPSEKTNWDKLQHPNMKVSLSEGALTQSSLKIDPLEEDSDTVDSKEKSGPLSRLRSFKMPNINLPTLPNSAPSLPRVRRKPRGVDSLNHLIESKISDGKCNTKIILI